MRTHRPDFFELILLRYLERHGQCLTFIQIGANDGQRFDPIYEFVTSENFKFSGLVVEPVPRFYRALKQVYCDQPGIKAINAAIHNDQSEATLYVVGEAYESKVPEWALGTASFNRDHVIKPQVPEAYVEAIQVPCLSLSELMRQESIEHIDLLQIDTEGYDAEIVRSINFDKVRPAMIHFEHGMGDGVMTQVEFDELIVLFNKNGYQVLPEKYDAVAFLPHAIG
ncbi:MAG: FkbM family methyltransferase [Alteromonadaceae bacterium]|uniref:FkbM family methyltransferase n=1 Tax=Marinobacter sp. TaxID=50741 RepID=UPI0029C553D0|nr:FkbM family methyltransferase [Marinobacter sp.]MDX5385994.1 FkbM family methyltransferase [Marinobacter sp.]MDX5441450.1 FkbM family methyltransferase [Alteromonadaceae bacterium]